MEAQENLEKQEGNVDEPKTTVKPAKVKIAIVVIKTKDKDGNVMKTPLVQFMIKHPDKEELLVISKVKFVDGDKAISKGFWIQLDDEGKVFKGSGIDLILKVLGCKTLAETYGREIDTVEESKDSPYLCLKAY